MKKLHAILNKSAVTRAEVEHNELVKRIKTRNRANANVRRRNKRAKKNDRLEYVPEDEKIPSFYPPITQFSLVQDGKYVSTDAARMLVTGTTLENGFYQDGKPADANGKFPDFKRVIPAIDAKTAITFQVEELLNAVTFCLVLGKRKNGTHFPIRFQVEENQIILSSAFEENYSTIEVDGIPAPFVPCDFVLNGKFLLDYLSALKRGDEACVLMEFFREGYPVMFSGASSQYVLMPITA